MDVVENLRNMDSFSLMQAVESGDTEFMDKCLKKDPEIINSCNVFCLFQYVNSREIISILLRHCGRKIIDCFKEEGKSILISAIEDGKSLDVIEEIILFDKDIANFTSFHHGDTPLMFAVKVINDVKIVKFLLNYTDINERDEDGYTVLHFASKLEIVELLLEKGANVDICANNGFTPLIEAIRNSRDKQIICALIKYNCNVNLYTKCDKTALMFAIELERDVEILSELIRSGADVDCHNFHKQIPLHLALGKKYEEGIIREIFNRSCNVNAEDENGLTPLCYALNETEMHNERTYSKDFIFELVRKGAVINTKLFLYAVKYCKNSEIIKECCINYDVDVKSVDSYGNCALHYIRDVNMVSFFVCKGVSINCKNNNNVTPLLLALYLNNIEIIKSLLFWGADPNSFNFCFLHKILVRDNILDLLVLSGANVSLKKKRNFRILCEILGKINEFTSLNLLKIWYFCIIRHIFISNEDVVIPNNFLEKSSVRTFLQSYDSELDKMKIINIVDNISFFDFCIKYYKSNRLYVEVSKSEFVKNDYEKVKEAFPIFYGAIIVKIKINIKLHKRIKFFNYLFGVSFNCSVETNVSSAQIKDNNCTVDEFTCDSIELINDCLYHVANYLSDGELITLLNAAILE